MINHSNLKSSNSLNDAFDLILKIFNEERTYYENVADGHGLNLPDALSKALKVKRGNHHLIHQLEHYANILKDNRDGAPMTTHDADIHLYGQR